LYFCFRRSIGWTLPHTGERLGTISWVSWIFVQIGSGSGLMHLVLLPLLKTGILPSTLVSSQLCQRGGMRRPSTFICLLGRWPSHLMIWYVFYTSLPREAHALQMYILVLIFVCIYLCWYGCLFVFVGMDIGAFQQVVFVDACSRVWPSWPACWPI